ncbi:MAG: peptidylprolyl isomerase [Nitrospiraceae bacterium]
MVLAFRVHHSVFIMMGALLACFMLAFGGCAPPSQDSPVLVIINGKPITQREFDFRWSELPESTKAHYEKEGGKRKFLDDLIGRELLMQQARKLGLDQSQVIRERTQRFKEQLILDELLQQVLKNQIEIPKEELEAYYVAHGAVLPAPERIQAAQIVTHNEFAAKDIKRMVDEGMDFAKLAQRYSTDKETRSKGGDLGLYRKGSADPQVEAVLLRLRPGAVSAPIKTESGPFYIIKLISREPGDTKAVHALRERLRQELYGEKRQKQFGEYLANLRQTSTIRMSDASRHVTEDTGH